MTRRPDGDSVAGMSRKTSHPMTVAEMARLGGIARAAKLSPAERQESARKAGKASARKRALKKKRR